MVDPGWSAADETIHVSASADSVLIHLSCGFISSINQSFLLENKNSPPLYGAHDDPPRPPYTTWQPFILGTPSPPIDNPLWVRYVDRITTVNGVSTRETVTAHILDIGSDWTLRTVDNPVTGAGAEVAGLAAPFFYADGEHTFYVEPALTETSLPASDGWVIPAITANLTFDLDRYWDGLDLHGQVPATTDAAFAKLSPAARFAVTARADWTTTSSTIITYQGVPVTAPSKPIRRGAGDDRLSPR